QNEEVFSTPEQLPEFPGGMTALLQFLRDNIKYPENQKNDVRVIVRFTVFKDGSLGDYNILKTGGEDCDKEVIRVLNLSPRWTPGKNDGKNVACSFALPVNFKMTDDNTEKSNTPE
ncbi:MAG: energy transducer TonB, partial [Muribaculaceae bacterium]|nr:energy transducer TonB [Muribaculaceae bacterium]